MDHDGLSLAKACRRVADAREGHVAYPKKGPSDLLSLTFEH
jgi:hypothetical protein